MSDDLDAILRKLHTLEFLIRDQNARIATLELAVRKLDTEGARRHKWMVGQFIENDAYVTPVEVPDDIMDLFRKPPPHGPRSDSE